MTGKLDIAGGVTLTINGAEFTISPASTFSDTTLIGTTSTSTLNLNKVTIDGASVVMTTVVSIGGTLNADDVTFSNALSGPNVNVDGTASLTDVLFEGNVSYAFHSGGNASALNVSSFGGAVTITNAVFRDNTEGGAAISVNAAGSGSVTTNGCLTFSGNIPYNVHGMWTDNSTRKCSDTIGNGDSAVIAAPTRLPCGLPGAGFLDRSANYVLRSDCTLSGADNLLWRISEGVNIGIQGNGNQLSAGSGNSWNWIQQAGNSTLTIRNVEVDHAKFYTFGNVNVRHATFDDTPDRVFFNVGDASFRDTIFEDISSTRTSENAALLYGHNAYGGGNATFTNVVFRRITSSGAPVLHAGQNVTITLNGCITFDSNTAPDHSGTIVDNRTGTCGPDVALGPTGPIPEGSPPVREKREVSVKPTTENCFQGLGAIGLICRPLNLPEPIIHIWGITPESAGYYILSVAQSQIEAQTVSGLVASSPDGRLAVRIVGNDCVVRDARTRPQVRDGACIARQLTQSAGGPISNERFTIVSMGPSIEGKVHSVVFDNGVAGSVIGTVDSFTGLPGTVAARPAGTASAQETTANANLVVYAPDVIPQPAKVDGSIVHVVQPGDTLWTIGIAYKVGVSQIVKRNQLSNEGRLIHPGQSIIIRDPT